MTVFLFLCVCLLAIFGTTAEEALQVSAAVQCNLNSQYRLEAWGDNSIRVRIGPDSSLEKKQQALLPMPAKSTTTVTTSSACTVTSGNLKVELREGKLAFTSVSDGKLLVEEFGHEMCPTCGPFNKGNGSMSFISSDEERTHGLG